MRTLLAARFAALFAVLASATSMAIEEPDFQVLEQQGSFELREYPAYVVAETRVEAGFASAGNIAFQRLFGYISGRNVAQQKIAMTAPVSQVADGDAFLVAFTLPVTYTLQTAPKPLDPKVHVRKVPAQLMACWRYTGRWTESSYRDNERLLREQIAKRRMVASGEPVLARYNPPFTPWFMRRNEVMIPVE